MKTKEKNILKMIINICLIISIILLSMFARAKYIEQKNGQATAEIAEMKFKINEKYYNSTEEIEFTSTITKQNPKVADGILAPGTEGCIPIIIDAKESKTSLEYKISIELKDRPTNLKFYSDEARKEEILVRNNNITKNGYVELNSNNNEKVKNENIYWLWEEETGETRNQILNNDIEDSKFMDSVMMMKIKINAKQIDVNPMYLKDNVDIGDTIKYKIAENDIITGIVVNKTENQIEFMPVNNDTRKAITVGYYSFGTSSLSLSNVIEKYNNCIINLDNEAKKFNSEYVKRALTIEDVNRLTGFEPSEDNIEPPIKQTYTSGTFIVDELMTINGDTLKAISLNDIMIGDIINIGDTIDNIRVDSITVNCRIDNKTKAYYGYSSGSRANPIDFFDTRFCLASKYIILDDRGDRICRYGIREFNNFYEDELIRGSRIIRSNGETFSFYGPVVPVISVPSTAHTKQITDESNQDIICEVIE